MTIDFEKKFYDDLGQELRGIKDSIASHNDRHEKDLSELILKQDRQSDKLEQIHQQTLKFDRRVTDLEKLVSALQKAAAAVKRKGLKLPAISDRVMTLLATLAVILVLIVANRLGVDVAGVFK